MAHMQILVHPELHAPIFFFRRCAFLCRLKAHGEKGASMGWESSWVVGTDLAVVVNTNGIPF